MVGLHKSRLLAAIASLALLLTAGSVASAQESATTQNGGFALTMSKNFISSNQKTFKRAFISQMQDTKLKDVRVHQKTDLVRLTSVMSDISIASINLDSSHFDVDFWSNSEPSAEASGSSQCVEDFSIELSIKGGSLEVSFQQWLEAESSKVQQEWGVGSFTLMDFSFSVTLDPFIVNNNFRLNIVDTELTLGDYKYVLRTRENSHFEEILDTFTTVLSEHMRQAMVSELSTKFGVASQQVSYGVFRRLQQNNRIGETSIFMNKHVTQVCLVPGDEQHQSSFSIELGGGFQRIEDAINFESGQSEVQLTGSQQIEDDQLLLYLSKNSFDSLLQSMFRGEGNMRNFLEPIEMKVDDAEDLAEGFTNAFDEDDTLKVNVQIDNIYSVQFDQTFANIPFKAEASIWFSNPINEKLSSAMAEVAFKGTAELDLNDDMSLAFKVTQEQMVIQKFSPFFSTETTKKQFEKAFTSQVTKKIMSKINTRLQQGVELPLGWDSNQFTNQTISIYKDFLLITQSGKDIQAPQNSSGDHTFGITYFVVYEMASDEEVLRKYPISYEADRTKKVKKLVPSADRGPSSGAGRKVSASADKTAAAGGSAQGSDKTSARQQKQQTTDDL